jgi:hypothetical protein
MYYYLLQMPMQHLFSLWSIKIKAVIFHFKNITIHFTTHFTTLFALRPLLCHISATQNPCLHVCIVRMLSYACVCDCVSLHIPCCSIRCIFIRFLADFTACMIYLWNRGIVMWNRCDMSRVPYTVHLCSGLGDCEKTSDGIIFCFGE